MNLTTKPGEDQASGQPAPYTATSNLVFGQVVATRHTFPTIAEIASNVASLLGVQTFPVKGKDPLRGHQWRTEKARTTPGLQASTAWAHATGYAITALPGSDLYIVDSDSLTFLRQLLGKFPDILLHTPVVYSGNRRLAADGH